MGEIVDCIKVLVVGSKLNVGATVGIAVGPFTGAFDFVNVTDGNTNGTTVGR